MASEETEPEDAESEELGPNEVYCTSCGEVIKSEAEVCPQCGVRQKPDAEDTEYTIPEHRRYELEKIANKSVGVTVVLGILISPLGYVMLGKWGLAAINFITLNYVLLGPIIVPIHCYKIIQNANEELRRAGVEGY